MLAQSQSVIPTVPIPHFLQETPSKGINTNCSLYDSVKGKLPCVMYFGEGNYALPILA